MFSPSQKLIEVILAEFQKTLRNTYDYKWAPKHGRPPSQCYVAYVTKGSNWIDIGTPLAAWTVSLDSIEPAPIQAELPEAKIDGMFYDLCRGFFSFTPDGKMAFVNWQTGPRFARGFKHSIQIDSNGDFSLGQGVCLWRS